MSDVTPSETGDLRSRILRAAVERFATHGYAATSVREVVEAVGCTKPALYYHFGSKEELFVESVQTHIDAFLQLLDEVLGQPTSVRTRLRALASALIESVRADPTPMRLVLTAQHRPDAGQPQVDLLSLHRQFSVRLETLVTEGVGTGELRGDLPAGELARAFIALVNMRLMGILYGIQPQGDAVDVPLEIYLHGAAPRTESR